MKSKEKGDPFEQWLDRYPPPDKDAELDGALEAEKIQRDEKRYLKKSKPERSIDLHGMSVEECTKALSEFISEAHRDGLRKVLIVHGKGLHSGGESVLRRSVHDYLRQSELAGEMGDAERSDGGRGATWVILRYRSL